MKIGYFILLALTTSALSAHAREPAVWPLVYDGKTLPLDAGAITRDGKDGGAFARPAKENFQADVQADGLRFEFPSAGTFGMEIENTSYSFREGSTLECRLRLEGTTNRIVPQAENTSAVMIQFSEPEGDDPGIWSLGFYTSVEDGKNYAVLEGTTSTQPREIGREFHTYRVVAEDDVAMLYIDGKLVGEVKPRKGVRPFGMRFGNLRGGDHSGSAVLSYIKIDPEKAWKP